MTSHPTNRFAATPDGVCYYPSLLSSLSLFYVYRSRPFESRSLARGWKGEHSEKIPGYRLRFICFRIRGRGNQDSRLNIAREVHTRKIIQKEKYTIMWYPVISWSSSLHRSRSRLSISCHVCGFSRIPTVVVDKLRGARYRDCIVSTL